MEIDLLRRGHRVLTVPISQIPRKVRTTYQTCVWRARNPAQVEVYAIPLRSPLPSVRVPLRDEDVDIRLDLQAIVALAYRKGRYHATINYDEPPDPPLSAGDAKWTRGLVSRGENMGDDKVMEIGKSS